MPRLLTTDEFVLKAHVMHDNKYDYSRVIYTHSNDIIEIICPTHGIYFQKAAVHLTKRGCRKCSNESKTLSTDRFVTRAQLVHGNDYDYSCVQYNSTHTKIEINCRIHGSFYQTPSNHLQGSGCSLCNPGARKVSYQESAWLDYMCIETEYRQHRINLDKGYVFVDALKDGIVYEYLGDFWHGNPACFSKDDINIVAKKSFGELYTETMLRIKNLEDKGYKVEHIWEYDWKKIRGDL
jgi:hypothetical protein